MILGKPAPFVRAFVEAVDDAIREHHPSHAMSSAMQRTWLAFSHSTEFSGDTLSLSQYA